MSSIFNRRAALGVLGASAGAFVLAACDANRSVSKGSSSSSSEPSETSPSASSATTQTDIDMSGDYKGKINFESVLEYKKSGTYEPATEEHAARNVPQPKKPEDANDKSLKGLYLSVAFAAAATQYAYNTGTTPWRRRAPYQSRSATTTKGLRRCGLRKSVKATTGRIMSPLNTRLPSRNRYKKTTGICGPVLSRLHTASLRWKTAG